MINPRRTVWMTAQQNTLLDGNKGETFVFNMRSNIHQFAMRNVIPGQLYVFMLCQDTIGNHTINWGSQMLAGAILDPAPDSITVQSFLGLHGEMLIALPGTWTEE